jgi:hypothetical protein
MVSLALAYRTGGIQSKVEIIDGCWSVGAGAGAGCAVRVRGW